MTTQQFCDWFYAQEQTPEPSELKAKLDELHAMMLAAAVEKEIEQKFKLRGWTTGFKAWEKRLLHLAKLALGKPGLKDLSRTMFPPGT